MASVVDREFDAGDSFNYIFNMKNGATNLPVDLTGYTVKMQLRETICSSIALEVIGTITMTPPTDPNDPTTGKTQIILPITPAESAALAPDNCKRRFTYQYDIELRNDAAGIVDTILKGKFFINKDITR